MARGGGRIDWQRSWADWITVTGDLYGGKAKEEVLTVLAVPVQHNGDDSGSIAGGHILGRWEHTLAGEDTALQVYYDDQSRFELTNHSRTRTEDIDFQDHVVGRHNDIVWGSELRFSQDEIRGVVQATIQPLYRNYLADGFLQDEITLVPHRLTATVGSKIQDGTLAGFQIQPSARIFWAIQPNRTAVWGAVSLAAVSPAIQEKGLHLPLALGIVSGLPLTGTIMGNQAYKDEQVLAYEAGFRRRFAYHFVFDMATFINRYRRLESLTSSTPQFEPIPAPHINMNFVYSNAYRAQSQGIESSLGWKPKPNLTFQASYSWMQSNSQQVTPGNITQIDSWATPRNNLAVSGSWNITSQWSVDSSLYNVGTLATGASLGLGSDPGTVAPAYTRLDLHVVRKVGRSLEFAAGGTNLLTPRHLEFGNGTDFVTPEYVPRSIFVNASWSF